MIIQSDIVYLLIRSSTKLFLAISSNTKSKALQTQTPNTSFTYCSSLRCLLLFQVSPFSKPHRPDTRSGHPRLLYFCLHSLLHPIIKLLTQLPKCSADLASTLYALCQCLTEEYQCLSPKLLKDHPHVILLT